MSKAPHSDPTDLPKGFSQAPLFPIEEVPGHSHTPEEITALVHLVGEATAGSDTARDDDSIDAEARADALTEGSGISTSLARRMTGQEKVPYYPPKPTFAVKSPVRPHHSSRGGRSFPESDRDYTDEMAGPLVGPVLPLETQKRINAEGAQLWRAALQEALQSRQATSEQSSTPVQPWIAPAQVAADMNLLGSDPRASFRPSTDGERTIAVRLLECLNPDDTGPNGIDAYLARQHRFMKMSKQKRVLSELGRQSSADMGVREEIAGYGRYAHDHARKLTSVRALSSFLGDRGDTEKVSDLLMKLPNAGDMKRGLLVLVQHAALQEVAAHGQSSMGVSPFRNLGVNFDEIAARLDTILVDGYSKRDQVLRYAQDRLGEMTVANAKKNALVAAKFQWNGVSFWSRVLESIGGNNLQTAKEVLEAVWRI